MTKERTMYQLPRFLKLGMIVSEILIINLIFYYFYKGILCPGSEHPFDISYQFGFMTMAPASMKMSNSPSSIACL